MHVYGLSSLSEFMDDFILYRSLKPLDDRLPTGNEIKHRLGLDPHLAPRKSQDEYARIMVEIMKQAMEVVHPGRCIQRFVCIGDTMMNDGSAYANIADCGEWESMAFIGADRNEPATAEMVQHKGRPVMQANRWELLLQFETQCKLRRFPIDDTTMVMIDIDKTALGARGRNCHMINRTRVGAIHKTLAELLGREFNMCDFEHAYNTLNTPEYHSFTTDNQDYLAYICLMLGHGVFTLDSLTAAVHDQQLKTFLQFIEQVDTYKHSFSPVLRDIHEQVAACVRQGDPTPFKLFRRNEYLATIAVMGTSAGSEANALLDEEIVITQEVRQVALDWKKRGAVIIGLSDKPDEASLPDPEHCAPEELPLHKVNTHCIGA